MDLTPINLINTCRTCLSQSVEMHSIFGVVKNEESKLNNRTYYIHEVLTAISGIKISTEDNMPTKLCTVCLDLTNTIHKFRQCCSKSQTVLEECIRQINQRAGLLPIYKSDYGKDDHENNFINVDYVDNETTDGLEYIIVNTEETKDPKLESKTLNNVTDLELQDKTAEISIKVHTCTTCPKTYKSKSSLRIHMRIHTAERPFVCSLCGKNFRQHSTFKSHLRTHSGEQPYKCNLCGKKYKQDNALTIHMRVHTGQRPFLCSICGRGFRQAADLGYHMRTHTKEKPYMCNICGKTMTMHSHLVQHMRSHTGERPFNCKECNKSFPSTTRLKRHTITHTELKPFKCEVCGRCFNRKNTLQVHAKIHMNDRPHVCSLCGKGFIQAHNLKTHLKTHCSSINSRSKSVL